MTMVRAIPKITVLCVLLLPMLALADTSVIYSNTSASASSGGQVATSGQLVSSGNSSATVQVRTTVNSNDNGGVYENTIDATVNGVHHTETVTKPIPPSGTVIIDVSTSTARIGSISPFARPHFTGRIFQSLQHFFSSFFSLFFR